MSGILSCGRGHSIHFCGVWPEGMGCPECAKEDMRNDALAAAVARHVEAMLIRHGVIKPPTELPKPDKG